MKLVEVTVKGSETLWHDFRKLTANAGETKKRATVKMRKETILRYSGRQRCLRVAEVLKN